MTNLTIMTKQEIFEESVLIALDTVAEQATEQATKIIVDLFKSVVLKKYKDAFDQELAQGTVHRKIIDKAVEFCYSDICVSIRKMLEMSDSNKEKLTQEAKRIKEFVKVEVERILVNKGIEIIS